MGTALYLLHSILPSHVGCKRKRSVTLYVSLYSLLLNPATPFPVKEILKKHETEFFSVVDARLSLRKLKRLQVITQDIMALINAATNDEDAQEILYEHLTDHADVDSLLKYCEVIIAAEGYPRMQSLGMKMKEDLQCMQRGWCVCTLVRVTLGWDKACKNCSTSQERQLLQTVLKPVNT